MLILDVTDINVLGVVNIVFTPMKMGGEDSHAKRGGKNRFEIGLTWEPLTFSHVVEEPFFFFLFF